MLIAFVNLHNRQVFAMPLKLEDLLKSNHQKNELI